jgi:hypothetical protein
MAAIMEIHQRCFREQAPSEWIAGYNYYDSVMGSSMCCNALQAEPAATSSKTGIKCEDL